MIYELKNGNLTAKIDSFGAELISITGNDKTEYIWQRDEAYWANCAPILFPIVGRLNNGEYTLNNNKYKMNIHGFCRGSEFSLEKHADDKLCLKLSYSENTLEQYPFLFDLYITFILINNSLEVKYEVVNLDNKTMYFSIGAHPGFNIPWDKTSSFTDYYLEFEQKETAHIHEVTENKFLKRDTRLFLDNESKINLNHDLFKIDALIFNDLKSDLVTIKSTKSNKSIEFKYPDFTTLAVWTKPDAPFICLEPWFGHGDFYDYKGDFINRDGTLSLDASKSFVCTHTIIINE